LVLRELAGRGKKQREHLSPSTDSTGSPRAVAPAGTSGEFRELAAEDARAPTVLRAFARHASVFRDELDRPVRFVRVLGDEGTRYVKQLHYDAIPLASRRAMEDMAKERRIQISVIPE
jgi:hypothetical protein